MSVPLPPIWLSTAAWLPLIRALLHTLWQGALAAGGLGLVLRFVPVTRPSVRYGAGAAALVGIVCAALGTWAAADVTSHRVSARRGEPTRTATGSSLPGTAFPDVATRLPAPDAAKDRATEQGRRWPTVENARTSLGHAWVPWAAAGWLLGVGVGLLRTVRGTLGAERLRRRCRELTDPRTRALAELLRARLGVSRRVRFLVCEGAGVPSMLGIFYPAVLLPASLLTGAPPELLRAVLAHELAHVRRWDYLANLAQMLVEALLFFNPFVWWISRQMRLEREACCDRLAAAQCESPASYVEALVAVVERSQAAALPGLPMLAVGEPGVGGAGSTLERARRLLVAGYQPVVWRVRWSSLLAMLFLAGLVLGGMWLGTRAIAQSIQVDGASPGPTTKRPDPPRDLADLDPKEYDTIWELAYTAIKAGDLQTIAGLLRRGLDVNLDLVDQTSLLFLAADEDQPAIVRLLLAHGADLQAKTSWGDTALRRACWRGFKDVADLLIQAGSPVDELLYASGTGDVAALAARDSRQPLTFKEVRECLFFALASGHPRTFEFLWPKLGPLQDPQKAELLADLYRNAARWGQPEFLPVLEALGASREKDGGVAMVEAASMDRVAVVRALLEGGVSPNARPPRWNYPLRDAAGDGHLEIVRALLDHGADLNVQDGQGFTPLAWAAYNGHEDVCLLLLDHGADARIEDHDGRNAAWHAVGTAHCPEALARMLKSGVPIDGRDHRGDGVLHYLMSFGVPEAGKGSFFMKVYSPADVVRFNERERRVVELLLAAGVGPDGVNGQVPLVQAMYSGHYAAAEVLLGHGADPTRRDKDGNTALYELVGYALDRTIPLDLFKTLWRRSGSLNPEFAVPGITPPITTSLLEMVISAAGTDPAKRPSLHEILRTMFDGGATFAGVADANAQALLQGAVRGDLAAVQQSIRRGASINAVDGKGWDALSLATRLGYVGCADWLIDHGADVHGHGQPWFAPLPNAVAGGQTALVEKLLAKGATLDGVYSGLFQAARQKNTRLFDVLLRAGADPKERSNVTMSTGGKTFTPHDSVTLYVCIENGLTDMARTLLDKGADAEPPHLERDRNLAYWAVRYDRPEILRSLLAHGANPRLKDEDGESALDLARKSHPKLVPMLEEAVRSGAEPGQHPPDATVVPAG